MNHIVPYARRYRLPPALQRQVNQFLMLTEALTDDADPLDRPLVVFDPEAGDAAARMMLDRRPALPEVIGQWMTDLGDATASIEPGKLVGRIGMVVRVLGDLPAFCWNEDSLIAASERFTHYPAVAELSALLRPIADRHAREIGHLEAMARAPRPVEYRESTEPYQLPPPPETVGRPRRVDYEGGGRDNPTFEAPAKFVDEHVEAARKRLAEVRARRFGGEQP
jgi:hypothetical protein